MFVATQSGFFHRHLKLEGKFTKVQLFGNYRHCDKMALPIALLEALLLALLEVLLKVLHEALLTAILLALLEVVLRALLIELLIVLPMAVLFQLNSTYFERGRHESAP